MEGGCLLDLEGHLLELQDLLGYHTDIVTEKGLRERIRGRGLKGAVALLEMIQCSRIFEK